MGSYLDINPFVIVESRELSRSSDINLFLGNGITSNQFIDGMRKIFELQPFINLNLNEDSALRETRQCDYAIS